MLLRSVRRAVAALTVCATLAFAQTLKPQDEPPASGSIRIDVELVNLLCTVQDRSGAYVNDLGKDDFTVLEDGRPQPITHFARQTDQALTLAFLFDVSFSMRTSLSAETDAARQFFRRILRPGDGAMLGGFAAAIGLWQSVTSSPQTLEQALDRVPEVGEALKKGLPPYDISVKSTERYPSGAMMVMLAGDGGSRLYDAVDLVSARQLHQLSGRKAIIALTDGEDDGSERTLKQAAQSALEADVLFFGIHCKDQVGVGLDNLKQLAAATGGGAFHIDRRTTLDAALRAIEEHLRNQYAIGYAPPDGAKKGTFHKLQIRVNRPGVTVHARSSYFR